MLYNGIKPTNLVKKISLSLIIATSITTNVLANDFDIFTDSGVQKSVSVKKFASQKEIFEDSNGTNDINIKKVNAQKDFLERTVLLGNKLGKEIKKEAKDEVDQKIIEELLEDIHKNNPSLGTNPQSQEKIIAQKDEKTLSSSDIFPPEETDQERKLRLDNAEAKRLSEEMIKESQERLARSMQPSRLKEFGESAYNVAKTTLHYSLDALEYVARTRPAAYLISYMGVNAIEEGFAYAGYLGTGAVATWYSGPTAGKIVADSTYYTIKAGFKVAHNVVPCFEGAVAYWAMGDVNSAVNSVLDNAPEAVRKVTSVVGGISSYITSFWG